MSKIVDPLAEAPVGDDEPGSARRSRLRRVGRGFVQFTIAYLLASVVATIAFALLTEPNPHVPIPALFAVVLSPIIPPLLAYSVVARLGESGEMQQAFFSRDVFSLCLFIGVFLPFWSLADKWISRWAMRSLARRSTASSAQRHPSAERNLEAGLAAARIELVDPEYIVDYAKARGLPLDEVHGQVKRKELGSCVHKGIMFVGAKKQ